MAGVNNGPPNPPLPGAAGDDGLGGPLQGLGEDEEEDARAPTGPFCNCCRAVCMPADHQDVKDLDIPIHLVQALRTRVHLRCVRCVHGACRKLSRNTQGDEEVRSFPRDTGFDSRTQCLGGKIGCEQLILLPPGALDEDCQPDP